MVRKRMAKTGEAWSTAARHVRAKGKKMSRRICSPENPYTKERDDTEPGRGWIHEGAHEVGDQRDNWPCGDLQDMECEDCGVRWTTELPQ